jgi:hypothetical protein
MQMMIIADKASLLDSLGNELFCIKLVDITNTDHSIVMRKLNC